jgi:hypothetical protein
MIAEQQLCQFESRRLPQPAWEHDAALAHVRGAKQATGRFTTHPVSQRQTLGVEMEGGAAAPLAQVLDRFGGEQFRQAPSP